MEAYSPRGSFNTVPSSPASRQARHMSPRARTMSGPQAFIDGIVLTPRHSPDSSSPVASMHGQLDNKVHVSGRSALPTCNVHRGAVGVVRASSGGRVWDSQWMLDMKELRLEVEGVRREQTALRTFVEAISKDLRNLCVETTRKVSLALVEVAEKRVDAAEKRSQEEMIKEITSRTAMMMKACEAVEASLKQEICSALAVQREEIESAFRETILGALEHERTARFQEMTGFHQTVLACVSEERVARLESLASLSTYIMACRITPVGVTGTGEESPRDVCSGGLSNAAGMLQNPAAVASTAHEKAASAMQQSLAALAEARPGPEIANAGSGADSGAGLCTIHEEQETREFLGKGRLMEQVITAAQRWSHASSIGGGKEQGFRT